MKSLAPLVAVVAVLPAVAAALIPAGTARADFVQDVGSPLPTGTAPYGVAAADLDGDGRPDLAAANGTAGSVTILTRGAAGGFTQEPGSPYAGMDGASDLAVADFNGDKKLDLAVAAYPGGGFVLLRKADNSGFVQEGGAIGIPATATVAAGDLDGDKRPDLVFGSYTTDSVYHALRNDANTGFDAPVQLPSVGHKASVALGDFTGDGQLDIVASNATAPTMDLWVQRDDHTFVQAPDSPFAAGQNPFGLAVADFNADGRPDAAVGALDDDEVVVLLGQAGGTFAREDAYATGDGPVGVETADFDSDGRPDLAIANQAGRRVTVLLRRAGGFAHDPSSPIVTDQAATAIATADFDRDTRVDMAVANFSSNSLSVLLNTTPFPPPPPGPPPPNLDADGDKVQVPADCRDDDASIFPGARDVPGDGIDQDCDHQDAPFPRLQRSFEYGIKYGRAYSVFTSLKVKPVRKGDRIGLRCKGGGCKVRKKTIEVQRDKPALSLTEHVKGARLRPGTSVTLRVTRPGTIGKYGRYTIRAGKLPKKTLRCLAPGSGKPVKCAA